jgi:CYTH domain-containing protein
MAKEIERKFLVQEVPDGLRRIAFKEIFQAYLSTSALEIRVRMAFNHQGDTITPSYHMTFKLGRGRIRQEFEFGIPILLYKILTFGMPFLYKIRSIYDTPPYCLDVDDYRDMELYPLKVVEVEFRTNTEAESFVPPSWFGREVTDEPAYKNKTLYRAVADHVA